MILLSIGWNDPIGEAKINKSKYWEDVPWATKVDALQDAIYELTNIYNNLLTTELPIITTVLGHEKK